MTFLKVLYLLALCSANIARPEFVESDTLRVPTTEFVSSVSATIKEIQEVSSVLSRFSEETDDLRLVNAVGDCRDLMDLSVDQLRWVVSASQNRDSEEIGTGNLNADMKTWLTGAFINQETCKEGFDGTDNGTLLSLISGNLGQISSSVQQLLSVIKPTPAVAPSRDGFPIWIDPLDKDLLINSADITVDAVVAADGTGKYTKIGDAIAAVPDYSARRYVIYVKRGVYYNEYVVINKKKWNVMMFGDGMDATVISGNRSHPGGWRTYGSGTFTVKGKGFIARDITFENTAGPTKEQAAAFVSDSDLSVLYRCAFRGYQDTLYAHNQRQFYRECQLTGTVDFIFGHASAVFQKCLITARKGLPGQKNTITAQGRNHLLEESGFSIQFCNISVTQDALNSSPSYLGRPWKPYSRTVVMQSYIGEGIRPEGWLEWNGTLYTDTLYYGEYMNYGPGAGLSGRVKWQGYHILNDPNQVSRFTVSQHINGDKWIPSTGITYTSGLDDKK